MAEDDKNIVLIGMMGAGKTYVGTKLAKLVSHFNYVDIDAEIEQREGMTISQIFEEYSEKYFRDLEKSIIKEYSKNKNQIISTGGGAFEDEENVAALKENGLVFYLKTSPAELFVRLRNSKNRPLLAKNCSLERIKTLLKNREKNYLKSDFVIETDGKQGYTILNDILSEYEKHVR